MSSNDNNKSIHTAASVRRSRWGVTATGAKTPLNNPNRHSTRASKKSTILGDAITEKVTTTTHSKEQATPNLIQLKCPPEVETRLNATNEVNQTQSQLKQPLVFETWEHGTPDAALTLSRLKEATDTVIDKLQHATATSRIEQNRTT